MTIKLNQKEETKLKKVALIYGISIDELVNSVINQVIDRLYGISEESLAEYKNAPEIEKAYKKALKEKGHYLNILEKTKGSWSDETDFSDDKKEIELIASKNRKLAW